MLRMVIGICISGIHWTAQYIVIEKKGDNFAKTKR